MYSTTNSRLGTNQLQQQQMLLSSSSTQHHHQQHHDHHQEGVATPIDQQSTTSQGPSPSTGAQGQQPVRFNGLNTTRPSNVPAASASQGEIQSPASAQPVGFGDGVVFEQEILVQTKHMDREEVSQPLQLTVSTGRGGTNGVSRCVTIRITDPRDPFFLYAMTLLEDEYGRFKEKNELHVDFAGFPRDVITMFNLVLAGPNSDYKLTFCVENECSGTLRVLQTTQFRLVEHLKLGFKRQGDEGQKQYLAERFLFFQRAFLDCDEQRRMSDEANGRLIDELRRDVEILAQERDAQKHKLDLATSESRSAHLDEMTKMKEESVRATEQQRQNFETENKELQARAEAQLSDCRSLLKSKEDECNATTLRLQNAESEIQNLQERLTRSTASEGRKVEEINDLQKQLSELQGFQQDATRRMTQDQLDAVATTERLRHLTESNSTKEEELRNLREQVRQHEGYVRMLTEQTKTAQDKNKTMEASLAKSHHIIKTMMSNQEVHKQKAAALNTQLDAKEEALREREVGIERLKAELGSSQDRVSMLQGQVSQVKEQLQKAEEEKETFSRQLKQNEDALLYMQRQTSAAGHRSYPVTATSTMPIPTTPSSGHTAPGVGSILTAPRGLHQEFAKNLHMGGTGGSSSTAGLGLRQPHFLQQQPGANTSERVTPQPVPTPNGPTSVDPSAMLSNISAAAPTSAALSPHQHHPSTVSKPTPSTGDVMVMGPSSSLFTPKPIKTSSDLPSSSSLAKTNRQVVADADSAYFPSSTA